MIGALIWLAAMASALLTPLIRRGPPLWRTSLVAVAVFWAVTAGLYPLPLAFPLTFLLLWAGIVEGTTLRRSLRTELQEGRDVRRPKHRQRGADALVWPVPPAAR